MLFKKDPLSPDHIYRFETFRLLTFHKIHAINVLDLCASGFFYKNNCVQCYKCHVSHQLQNIHTISNMLELHHDKCPFIFTKCEDNVKIGSENTDLIDVIKNNYGSILQSDNSSQIISSQD